MEEHADDQTPPEGSKPFASLWFVGTEVVSSMNGERITHWNIVCGTDAGLTGTLFYH